jgi:hypothetical protein
MTSLKSVLFSLSILTAVVVAPNISSRNRGLVATALKCDGAQPAMVAGPQCGGDDEKKPKS